MDNLRIYNAVRAVPKEAQKPILGGRLKGMTDVNPMWRIKTLTEAFGPCGEGWYYTIDNTQLDPGNGGEIVVTVFISLYYKLPDGQLSAPIPGVGGSMLVVKEKNGLYTDDEAYKKALTDAISVACKALGVAADVYWDKDTTKYTQRAKADPAPAQPPICAECKTPITEITGKSGEPISAASLVNISTKRYGVQLCAACLEKRKAKEENVSNA